MTPSDTLHQAASETTPTLPVSTPASCEEVTAAISKLRCNRASGVCGLQPVPAQSGDSCCVSHITCSLGLWWSPLWWKRGIILPLLRTKVADKSTATIGAWQSSLFTSRQSIFSCSSGEDQDTHTAALAHTQASHFTTWPHTHAQHCPADRKRMHRVKWCHTNLWSQYEWALCCGAT